MFTDRQVETLMSSSPVIVSGGRGTGKSSTVVELSGHMEERGMRPYVLHGRRTTPTSAAVRIRRVLGQAHPCSLLIDDPLEMVLTPGGVVDEEAEQALAHAVFLARQGELSLVLAGTVIPPLILQCAAGHGARVLLEDLGAVRCHQLTGAPVAEAGLRAGVYLLGAQS